MRLAGKICIVTGGGSGIGHATSPLFSREGAAMTMADLNSAAAEEDAAQIRPENGRAVAMEVDVSQDRGVRERIQRTVGELGRIDGLVDNAGYGFTASVVAIVGIGDRAAYRASEESAFVAGTMRTVDGGMTAQ